MKKYILGSGASWLAEFSSLVIVGLTPLFFNYFYPANIDLYKLAIFKIFTLLLLFAVVWQFSEFKICLSKKPLKSLLPFILLFVFLIISLLFSVDITTSWLGSYNRHEGLVSWLFYGLWAILLVFHLSEGGELEKKNRVYRLMIVSASAGFLVSIYALMQLFGLDFVTWSEIPAITGRSISSFGQPNYLACWLIIVLPLTAYLFSSAKNNWLRYLWIIFFITELAALFSTGSRAAFFVFLITSILWLLWYFAKNKILSRQKIVIFILSGLATLVLFISFLFISNPQRFQELTDFKKGSAFVRVELWRAGLEAVSKKPWLGYGLDNQPEAYVQYYKADWAVYARPNTYSDRAHNIILDILLTSGIIGLAFFIYFFRWLYLNLYRTFAKGKNKKLAAFLIWSLTAYLASLLFNFSVPVTNIYFWLIVSLSLILSDEPLITFKTEQKIPELSRLILILAAAAIFIYGSMVELGRLTADYYYSKAIIAADTSEYFTVLVLNNYIFETEPDKTAISFYGQGLSLRLIENLPLVQDKSNISAIKGYLALTNQFISDNNFENKFIKAFIFGILGNTQDSEKLFTDLISLSPELPKLYLAWGDTLLFNKNYHGAKVKFEQARKLLPDINNPYINNEQKTRLDFYQIQINNRLNRVNLLIK